MLKKIPLWVQILIGIAIGAIIGVAVPDIVPYISFLGDIFLRLLKMLIAPLVLLTLINGVCKMGDVGMLRKVGVRIVIYYMITSTLASAVGVIGGVITQPGKGVTDLLTSEAGEAVEYNFIDNMVSWIPENIFTSLSEGNTLQIIFFAIFMGCVLLVLGDRVKRLVDLVDQGAEAMLKMTEYVMAFSPIGIMALIADMVTTISANMMKQVIVFITTDWVCCLLVMFLMEPIIAAVLGRVNPMRLFKKIAPAIIVAASTCSATSFLRNWDSILEKKRANLRSISEPARLRQPPPRSTGAAHARGRAQSIREERRIAAPPVLFALLWVRLLPALYGPFCGPLRPFGGCPWGVTPPARECLPPAPPDTRRRG
ncbi:cation:dicarboxylate symporter family transporter [Muriventricola aceti]|uniref:cation:dicarboxylate symporter family transporter n=1 Tax=Muriventricola aceti TaxID=2981773 RepID=UPI000822D97A|nr:cation:dicarboxylase symporter family transporter [Muriventricola aceti]MCU6701972.1 cation:dicarboxylase symporter family transporter [Muriventricola aceti]SCI84864.1 Glutamate-aspartate carrier protein [uncultured Flavonifractor sp.]